MFENSDKNIDSTRYSVFSILSAILAVQNMSRFRLLHVILAALHKPLHRPVALAAALSLAALSPAQASPVFKLYIEAPGPYKVSYEDLQAVGLQDGAVASAGLGISNEGHSVPIWVEDGGDGIFGPGDWLEFVGKLPHGWVSYLNEHTRYNVYFLRFDVVDPVRMVPHLPRPMQPAEDGIHHRFRRRIHHERDYFIQRTLISHDDRPSELWFWAKISQISEPLVHELHLGDLDLSVEDTVHLDIELRGWSRPVHKPNPEMADHRVEVLLNGTEISSAEWDGTELYRLSIPDIPAKIFHQGKNDLALRVPKRTGGTDGDPLIDVIMLNWIEISYPRTAEIGGGWVDFTLNDPLTPRPTRLLTFRGVDFILYGENGSRMTSDALPLWPAEKFVARVFAHPPDETSFIAVGKTRLESPQGIVLERPSRLVDKGNRADYIIISHRRLIEAIRPLAEFHRSRGLEVEVVDVQDVYDEFSDGIVRPSALRDFLAHAYHEWSRPAPRFVLLVGDASWNGKDIYIGDGSFTDHIVNPPEVPIERYKPDPNKVDYTPYAEETDLVNRQLIPTWDQTTIFGHAANDNYFVAVDGDDDLPDMALGRLTVVEPSDVTSIVEKTIRYASKPEVGPWRRNLVFLTNTLQRFHNQSRYVAGVFTAEGFSTAEIYPDIEEEDNEQYTRQLVELFNEGQFAIHYLGHGGRFIWETGRRDFKTNRDLFTFDDLEGLNPTERLPVVLSLTCYSAPFDHPEADSLGETLLRMPDRGAIAVLAASWTNGPSGTWGQIILEEMTRPGATIGEAFMNSKHRNPKIGYVNLYNLLGDPAVPTALPSAAIELKLAGAEGGPLSLSGELEIGEFSGEVLVELVDENREILHSVTTPLEGAEFAVDFPVSAETLATASVARAYAWDVSRGIDAAAAIEVPKASNGAPEASKFKRRQRRGGKKPVEKPEVIPEATAAELLGDAIAWWSFDEKAGSSVRDRLDAHHGALIDRADRTTNLRGGAFTFYGHGFLDFGSDQKLDVGTGDFTLQAWISTRQARDQLWVILDKRTDIGYHLYNHLGRLGLQIADGEFSNFTGPFIADGRWRHVVVTVDRDSPDGVRWYLDGKEAGLRQDPTPRRGSLDNPAPLYVGGRLTGGGNFIGGLDEVAIFRRALSSADVANLYRGGWEWLSGGASAGESSSVAEGESTPATSDPEASSSKE